MYRKVDWFKYLCFSYDMSMPNVAHMEPQRGECCTVMPYFLPDGMLELPLTTTEDYSLFHILKDYSLAVWRQQIAIILDGHGLMSCAPGLCAPAARPGRLQGAARRAHSAALGPGGLGGAARGGRPLVAREKRDAAGR
jgi:hypothetical protein